MWFILWLRRLASKDNYLPMFVIKKKHQTKWTFHAYLYCDTFLIIHQNRIPTAIWHWSDKFWILSKNAILRFAATSGFYIVQISTENLSQSQHLNLDMHFDIFFRSLHKNILKLNFTSCIIKKNKKELWKKFKFQWICWRSFTINYVTSTNKYKEDKEPNTINRIERNEDKQEECMPHTIPDVKQVEKLPALHASVSSVRSVSTKDIC